MFAGIEAPSSRYQLSNIDSHHTLVVFITCILKMTIDVLRTIYIEPPNQFLIWNFGVSDSKSDQQIHWISGAKHKNTVRYVFTSSGIHRLPTLGSRNTDGTGKSIFIISEFVCPVAKNWSARDRIFPKIKLRGVLDKTNRYLCSPWYSQLSRSHSRAFQGPPHVCYQLTKTANPECQKLITDIS